MYHLNFTRPFAIPMVGGPGVGPICVAKHLVPFPATPSSVDQANAVTISGAPWGSALICLISYSYIRMLGANGLKKID